MPMLKSLHCKDLGRSRTRPNGLKIQLPSDRDWAMYGRDGANDMACASPANSVHSSTWSIVSASQLLDEKTPTNPASAWTVCVGGMNYHRPAKISDDGYKLSASSEAEDTEGDLDGFQLVQHSPTSQRSAPVQVTLAIATEEDDTDTDTLCSSHSCTSGPSFNKRLARLALAQESNNALHLMEGALHDAMDRYMALFQSIQDEGMVDCETVRQIWCRSQLSNDTLSGVWRACDPSGQGCLDQAAFLHGMSEIDRLLRKGMSSNPHTLRDFSVSLLGP